MNFIMAIFQLSSDFDQLVDRIIAFLGSSDITTQ